MNADGAINTHAQPSRRTAVATRKKISEGALVSVWVPHRARLHENIGPGGVSIKYYFLRYFVPGGFVAAHVRTNGSTDLRGKEIRARVEIWRKDLADGRSFVYIDLYHRPVRVRKHRLYVLKEVGASIPKVAQVIRLPAPLQGAIAIVPLGTVGPGKTQNTRLSKAKHRGGQSPDERRNAHAGARTTA